MNSHWNFPDPIVRILSSAIQKGCPFTVWSKNPVTVGQFIEEGLCFTLWKKLGTICENRWDKLPDVHSLDSFSYQPSFITNLYTKVLII
jgi:hypothetical protein